MQPRPEEKKTGALEQIHQSFQSLRAKLTDIIDPRLPSYIKDDFWEPANPERGILERHIPKAVNERDPEPIQFAKRVLFALRDLETFVSIINDYNKGGIFLTSKIRAAKAGHQIINLLYNDLRVNLAELSRIADDASIPGSVVESLNKATNIFGGLNFEQMSGAGILEGFAANLGPIDSSLPRFVETYMSGRPAAPATPERKRETVRELKIPEWNPSAQSRQEWFGFLLEPMRGVKGGVATMTGMLAQYIQDEKKQGKKFDARQEKLFKDTLESLKNSEIDEGGYYRYSASETPLSQSLKGLFNVLYAVNELCRAHWERGTLKAYNITITEGLKALNHYFKIDWAGMGADVSEVMSGFIDLALMQGRDKLHPQLAALAQAAHATERSLHAAPGTLIPEELRALFDPIESMYLARGIPVTNPFAVSELEHKELEAKIHALTSTHEQDSGLSDVVDMTSRLLKQYRDLGTIGKGTAYRDLAPTAVGMATPYVFDPVTPQLTSFATTALSSFLPGFVPTVVTTALNFTPPVVTKTISKAGEIAAGAFIGHVEDLRRRMFNDFPRATLLQNLAVMKQHKMFDAEELKSISAIEDQLIDEMTPEERAALLKNVSEQIEVGRKQARILKREKEIKPDDTAAMDEIKWAKDRLPEWARKQPVEFYHFKPLQEKLTKAIHAQNEEQKRGALDRMVRSAKKTIEGRLKGWPPKAVEDIIPVVVKQNKKQAKKVYELKAATEALDEYKKQQAEYAKRVLKKEGIVTLLTAVKLSPDLKYEAQPLPKGGTSYENDILYFNHNEEKVLANALYFKKIDDKLQYSVMDSAGRFISGEISDTELKGVSDLKDPLELKEINKLMPEILRITFARGHTRDGRYVNQAQKMQLAAILADLRGGDRTTYLEYAHEETQEFVNSPSQIKAFINVFLESENVSDKQLGHRLAIETFLGGYVTDWKKDDIATDDAELVEQARMRVFDSMEANQILDILGNVGREDTNRVAVLVSLMKGNLLKHNIEKEAKHIEAEGYSAAEFIELLAVRYNQAPLDEKKKIGLLLGRLSCADKSFAQACFRNASALSILRREGAGTTLYNEALVNVLNFNYVNGNHIEENRTHAEFVVANKAMILALHEAMHSSDGVNEDKIIEDYLNTPWKLVELIEKFIREKVSAGSPAERQLREFFSALILCSNNQSIRIQMVSIQREADYSVYARFMRQLTEEASYRFWEQMKPDLIDHAHKRVQESFENMIGKIKELSKGLDAKAQPALNNKAQLFIAERSAAINKEMQKLSTRSRDFALKCHYAEQQMHKFENEVKTEYQGWVKEIINDNQEKKGELKAEFKLFEADYDRKLDEINKFPPQVDVIGNVLKNEVISLIMKQREDLKSSLAKLDPNSEEFHSQFITLQQTMLDNKNQVMTRFNHWQERYSLVSANKHKKNQMHKALEKLQNDFALQISSVNTHRSSQDEKGKERALSFTSFVQAQITSLKQQIDELDTTAAEFAAGLELCNKALIANKKAIEDKYGEWVNVVDKENKANVDGLKDQIKTIIKTLNDYVDERKGIKATALSFLGFGLRQAKIDLAAKMSADFSGLLEKIDKLDNPVYISHAQNVCTMIKDLDAQHNALIKHETDLPVFADSAGIFDAKPEEKNYTTAKGGKLSAKIGSIKAIQDALSEAKLKEKAEGKSLRRVQSDTKLVERHRDPSDDLPKRISLIRQIGNAIGRKLGFLSAKNIASRSSVAPKREIKGG